MGFVIDLVVKNWAIATLDPANPPVYLGGFLTLQLIRNPGAAFSMGTNATVILSIIAILAFAFVLVWLVPRVRHSGWAVAEGFLLAGIAGNLADRLFREPAPLRGEVVDLFQLPHFAIFNVADMFITAAAIMIIWLMGVKQIDSRGQSTKDKADPESRHGAS